MDATLIIHNDIKMLEFMPGSYISIMSPSKFSYFRTGMEYNVKPQIIKLDSKLVFDYLYVDAVDKLYINLSKNTCVEIPADWETETFVHKLCTQLKWDLIKLIPQPTWSAHDFNHIWELLMRNTTRTLAITMFKL